MFCVESCYTNGTSGPKYPLVPCDALWLQTHICPGGLRQNGHHTELTGHQKQFPILLCYSICVIHNIFLHNTEVKQDVNGSTFHAPGCVHTYINTNT